MDEKLAVVDRDNQLVRWSTRDEIHRDRLIHRTIHVIVLDLSGERLLLQRRCHDKRTHPDHWDLSCAGHVEPQDDRGDGDLDGMYLRTARRELAEELGIHVEPEVLGHFPPRDGVHYEQLRLLWARHDGPFEIQRDEVAEVRFVTRAELGELLADTGAKITETLAFFAPLAIEKGWW